MYLINRKWHPKKIIAPSLMFENSNSTPETDLHCWFRLDSGWFLRCCKGFIEESGKSHSRQLDTGTCDFVSHTYLERLMETLGGGRHGFER